jgi:hypothetical protein
VRIRSPVSGVKVRVVHDGYFSVDRDVLVRHFGTYSLSREYDLIFEVPGSFIAGEDAVFVPVGSNSREPHVPGMSALPVPFLKLRTFPITGRDAGPARSFCEKLLKDQGVLACAWSGRPIRSRESLYIDHLLPFPVLRNNNLWNLLPASDRVNLDKKDKVPSLACIESCRPAIVRYWGLLREEYPGGFYAHRGSDKRYRRTGNLFRTDKKWSLSDKLHIVHIGKFTVAGQEGDIQPVRDRIPDTIDCR